MPVVGLGFVDELVAPPEHRQLIELTRVRLRDAVRVGMTVARANEAEAKGVRRSGRRRRRRRLHRIRAIYPPGPFRMYMLVLACVLSAAALPSWVGRTADDVAVVTVWPMTGPGRRRYVRRRAVVIAAVDVVLLGLIAVLYLRRPILLMGPALAALPIAWAGVTMGIEARSTGEVRRRQKVLVAAAPGPVHFAADLAGGGRGAGSALVHAMTERADAGGITLLARTERGPLVALYERAGFQVAAEAATWWGVIVLIVRHPRRPQPGVGR